MNPIDPHVRLAPVRLSAPNACWQLDAIAVFAKAVTAHGVPQRLLSDNGLVLNPSPKS